MNAVRNDVKELVQKEFDFSMTKYPYFSSPHEGYAVILEELDEMRAELRTVDNLFNEAWFGIKQNQDVDMNRVGLFVELLIVEAIQVAAMCKKFNESKKVPSDGRTNNTTTRNP